MSYVSISVIIPAMRRDKALMNLLGQLAKMNVFEIIIVQAEGQGSESELYQNCKWLKAPKGRGSQIQAGLDKAQGDILWILHADSILPQNCVSEIHRIVQDPFTAMGCFPLQFNYANIGLKLFAAFSHLPMQLTTFGDQGFFFHRDLKSSLPSLTPYPLLEDVILYQSLRKKGRVMKANYALTTDASRFRRFGIWHTQWRNAVTLWKFRRGVSAQQLYQDYYKDVSRPIRSTTSLSGL